jgi:hypothetical protein
VFEVDDDWAALVADDVDPAIAMTLVGPAERAAYLTPVAPIE